MKELKGNEKKKQLLGMPFGTAMGKLRKSLIFSLAQKAGMTECHQCGKEIEIVEELLIEHKKPWMSAEDPVEAFFSIDNIAFSHIKCNIAAASRPTKKYSLPRQQQYEANKRFYADPEKFARTMAAKKERYHKKKQMMKREN